MKRVIALVLSVVLISSCFEGIGRAEAIDTGIVTEQEDSIVEVETTEETEEITQETEQEPVEELIDLSQFSVKLEKTEYVYSGEAHCPAVTVTAPDGTVLVEKKDEVVPEQMEVEIAEEVLEEPLEETETDVEETETEVEEIGDYTVEYANNVNVGNASVVIKGVGKYKGEIVRTFKINAFASVPVIEGVHAYNKISLSWTSVEGAQGYELYRKEAGKDYTLLKKVTSCKFSNTSVKLGASYEYKVRAYRVIDGVTHYSNYSKVISKKVMTAAPVVKEPTWVTYNKIRLNWNKVSGATGYKVYRSTSPNGTYTRIATLKGTTYTDAKCSCGVLYYYKVKAYRKVKNKVYEGSTSEAVEKRTGPKKIQFTSTSAKYTTVSLKWKKSTGAQGYELYRSTSKLGEYELIKTFTKQSILSYKDTGLVKHQNYFYKIRPYRVVSGVKVYGNFSDIYSKPKTGWHYKNGERFYYNEKGKIVKDVRSIIGKQSQYYIKVNKKRCVTTIYAKDPATGEFNTPVVSFICSPGDPTPVGKFSITRKYRWKWLVGPSWGQWSCRYTSGKLFHTVYYLKENNANSLGVGAFNRLGTRESHGCIRLLAKDAKWMYDNCSVGTGVYIYESSTSGPFGKPSAPKLPSWHTWDPTDPTMKSKCNKRGCH